MQKQNSQKGFTLIEALISILVVSFLVFIYANTSYFIERAGQIKNTILAYNIAQEEIESLRNLNYDSLTNQIEGDFMNVVHNKGSWKVFNDGTTNVYELAASTDLGLTGLALLPFGNMTDYTLETDIKIDSDSPVTWESGFFFRIKDINNFYRVSFDSTDLYIYKKVNGVETVLFTSSLITTTNFWNTFKLVISGNNFEIYRNLNLLGSCSDPESSFSHGKIALLGINGPHSYFDDVKIDGSLVINGDFEAGPLDKLAEDWQWLSLYELPRGLGKLTIEDYEGDSNIKNIYVTVEWFDGNKIRDIELQTLISKYGIHL